jgi:chemotaxis protein MotB
MTAHAIWPSFTDVMSTMALLLFVMILLAYVKSRVSAKPLEAPQRQIDGSEHRLHDLRVEISAARIELTDANATGTSRPSARPRC